MAVAKPRKSIKKSTETVEGTSFVDAAQSREQSRINIRLAPAVKERVARAAALSGQDMTEFAVATLSEKADLIIERHDHLLLGSEDYAFFLNALDETTPEPSSRSLSIAEKYRQGTRKGVRYVLAD